MALRGAAKKMSSRSTAGLPAGTRLGPYEVLATIGVGGMGEVYKAVDTRLGRSVAIKILAHPFAADATSRQRFEREAKAISSLNHPHICTLYDVGSHDGLEFLVMEHLEGETLAERLVQRSLPLAETLRCAIEMADALEAAHERGIIHRDFKPANVMLTPDGAVKLLDFGIAKAATNLAGAGSSDALTLVTKGAGPVPLIGTPNYMSPEQVRGMPVDRRTDIWAFGCVLLEMLTGKRAFEGKTLADITTAILEREPSLSELPLTTPPAVQRLLRRCLEKDARRRLHDIADARIELEDALREPHASTSAAAGGLPPLARKREVLAWAAALGVAAVAVAVTLLRPDERNQVEASYTTEILLPDSLRLGSGILGSNESGRFALSPDGRRLAFVATDASGRVLLYVRALDSAVAQPLPGTENAGYPFWSPESDSIAFIADGRLKKVDLAGGAPITIADTELPATGAWNGDDVILFTPTPASPIHRVSASGGTPTPVTTLNTQAGEVQHWYPFFLPDDRHFLYFAVGSQAGATDARAVLVGSLDAAEPSKLLVQGGSNAKYANGHLFYARAGRLVAQPFDVERLELRGEAFPIVEEVRSTGLGATSAAGAFSVSETGVLAYHLTAAPRSQLAWFERSGQQTAVLGAPADYGDVMVSPDGTRAAVSVVDSASGSADLWIFDVARGSRERVTLDPGSDFAPIWSRATGREIIHSAQRGGSIQLYRRPAGVGQEELLYEDDLGKFASDWSTDGRFLVYIAGGGIIRRSDLWVLGIDGSEPARPFIDTPFPESHAQFSPDGRWLAYMSIETGAFEVYVTPFPGPGPGERRQVSTVGGGWPRWRRDGRELFYLAADPEVTSETPDRYRVLTAVTVDGDSSSFQILSEERLFVTQLRPIGRLDAFPYDVSADGQRFLLNTSLPSESAPITLVVNWPGILAK
jgi:serine/threonine protein kinase/Tol biopolymer transport system component